MKVYEFFVALEPIAEIIFTTYAWITMIRVNRFIEEAKHG